MHTRVMYTTKLSVSQLEQLRNLSIITKIPQTKLIEDALLLLFAKHEEIQTILLGRKLNG